MAKTRTTDIEINGNHITLTNKKDNLVIYMDTANAYYYNVSARFISVDHPNFHKTNMLFMNGVVEKGSRHTYLRNLYNNSTRLCLYDGHITEYTDNAIKILMGFFSSKAYRNSLLYKTNHMINLGRLRKRQAIGCRKKAQELCTALNNSSHQIHNTSVVSTKYPINKYKKAKKVVKSDSKKKD